jgi:hypothetical protein
VKSWFTYLYNNLVRRKMSYVDGGPIVGVQIENEFGFYGSVKRSMQDYKYIMYLIQLAVDAFGPSMMLCTCA